MSFNRVVANGLDDADLLTIKNALALYSLTLSHVDGSYPEPDMRDEAARADRLSVEFSAIHATADYLRGTE